VWSLINCAPSDIGLSAYYLNCYLLIDIATPPSSLREYKSGWGRRQVFILTFMGTEQRCHMGYWWTSKSFMLSGSGCWFMCMMECGNSRRLDGSKSRAIYFQFQLRTLCRTLQFQNLWDPQLCPLKDFFASPDSRMPWCEAYLHQSAVLAGRSRGAIGDESVNVSVDVNR
jgi:hypothetical protein